MRAKHKTRAPLINSQDTNGPQDTNPELVKMRQRVAELEALVTMHEQVAAAEHEQRVLAETLQQVGTALSSSLAYDRVLDCILEQVSRVVSHDAACIMLIEANIARIFRWHGYKQFGTKHKGQDPFASLTFNVADTPTLRL